jgi:hypothetical protein
MNLKQTGAGRVYVRREFSDEAVWRDALGNGEPLYVHSCTDTPPDAPEYLAAGSTLADDVCTSLQRTTHREDTRWNYL